MLSILGAREVFPETLRVVGKLRKRYRIYIASTSDHEPLMSDLERNRLVVDRSFTSESLRAYKPKAEFYTSILEETGLRPEEAVFVGDSPVDDVLGPKSVGMKAAWINRNNRRFPDEIPAPDYQLVDLNGLLSIL
ncbi:MAG TPA: HAD family hydrolase [Armatimonadota bacterium]|nr:HAD family hydrolase [Armatimonadota bacterium]